MLGLRAADVHREEAIARAFEIAVLVAAVRADHVDAVADAGGVLEVRFVAGGEADRGADVDRLERVAAGRAGVEAHPLLFVVAVEEVGRVDHDAHRAVAGLLVAAGRRVEGGFAGAGAPPRRRCRPFPRDRRRSIPPRRRHPIPPRHRRSTPRRRPRRSRPRCRRAARARDRRPRHPCPPRRPRPSSPPHRRSARDAAPPPTPVAARSPRRRRRCPPPRRRRPGRRPAAPPPPFAPAMPVVRLLLRRTAASRSGDEPPSSPRHRRPGPPARRPVSRRRCTGRATHPPPQDERENQRSGRGTARGSYVLLSLSHIVGAGICEPTAAQVGCPVIGRAAHARTPLPVIGIGDLRVKRSARAREFDAMRARHRDPIRVATVTAGGTCSGPADGFARGLPIVA